MGTIGQTLYDTVDQYIKDRPVSSLGTLGTTLLGANLPTSLIIGGITRGIDAVTNRDAANKDIEAMGIHATGPAGQDRRTSALEDFIPIFGRTIRKQKQDIVDAVKAEIDAAPTWNPGDADTGLNAGGLTAPTGMPHAPVTMTLMGPPGNRSPWRNADRPTNTANNPFYGRGRYGPNAASLLEPVGGGRTGNQYNGVVSYPNGPNNPVTTYDDRVDLPGARDVSPDQVQNLIDSGWTAEGGDPHSSDNWDWDY
tara:strand:- start:16038 stop:16796 length:759 start_codon:yes stop_codon:yes gene_type:complete